MSTPSWPIVIVTGANGGVGFGICQRLIFQLCEVDPTDAQPQSFSLNTNDNGLKFPPCEGLTLIMACRSVKRAEAARAKLYRLLNEHIEKLEKRPGYDGHADKFRQNLKIDIESLDLASLRTVFVCVDRLSQKYPYISHIICNAGFASFRAINWPACIWQLLTDFVGAVTAPNYYLQYVGEKSVDGLGWVWQCNFFGHYVLYRALEPLLRASTCPLGSRVIWMSSLEASPVFYDSEDWQLLKTEHSYGSAKYQIDIAATHLDHKALEDKSMSHPTRHIVAHPGVCSTNVAQALAGSFLSFFKVLSFYLGRWFGSPHHAIDPFKAAISSVHLSLVSLTMLTFMTTTTESSKNGHASVNGCAKLGKCSVPVRFGAETDRWGRERVGITEVKQWRKHQDEAAKLLSKCEALFMSFRDGETVLAN